VNDKKGLQMVLAQGVGKVFGMFAIIVVIQRREFDGTSNGHHHHFAIS
jgi:phage protein U